MTSPRTLLGPLTTTWTAPPVCNYYMGLCQTCSTQYLGQTCNSASKIHDWTDCWPPRASPLPDPGVFLGWGLYSPGLVCPYGFSTIAKATAGGSTDASWGVEYSLIPGETAIACCPTGFGISYISVSSTYGQTCVLTATSTTYPTVQCVSGSYTGFGDVTLTGSMSNTIYAPLFQLNYQLADLPLVSTRSSVGQITSSLSSIPSSTSGGFSSPSSTASSGSSSSSPTSSTSNPAASTSTAAAAAGGGSVSDNSNGLSRGAVIGIAVGCSIAGLLILLGLALFIRRRKRAPRELPPTDPHKVPPAVDAEMGGGEIRELDGNNKPSELAAAHYPRDTTSKAGTGPAFRTSAGFPYTDEDLRRPTPIFELEGDNVSNTGLSQANSREGAGIEDDVSSLGSARGTGTRAEHGEGSPHLGDAGLLSPMTPTRKSFENKP